MVAAAWLSNSWLTIVVWLAEKVQTVTRPGKHDLEGRMKAELYKEGVAEESVWEDDALGMASVGLKRLVQLSEDQHARDPSVSVVAAYSQHLAKVMKEVGMEFDVSMLQ